MALPWHTTVSSGDGTRIAVRRIGAAESLVASDGPGDGFELVPPQM